MKKTSILFLLLALFFLAGCGGGEKVDLVTKINKEVVIYSTQIDYTSTPKKSDSWSKFWDRLMSRDIILPVKVSVKGATYCSEISDYKVDTLNTTIEFTLPKTRFEIDGVKIDWENSETKVGWFRQNFSAEELQELSEIAEAEAKKDTEKNFDKYDALAKQHAIASLSQFIERFGYKSIIH